MSSKKLGPIKNKIVVELVQSIWFDAAIMAFVTSTKLSYVELVSTWIGDDLWRIFHSCIYPGHSGPLSLAIPPWVGAMSTGDGFGRLWEETPPQLVYKCINKT